MLNFLDLDFHTYFQNYLNSILGLATQTGKAKTGSLMFADIILICILMSTKFQTYLIVINITHILDYELTVQSLRTPKSSRNMIVYVLSLFLDRRGNPLSHFLRLHIAPRESLLDRFTHSSKTILTMVQWEADLYVTM